MQNLVGASRRAIPAAIVVAIVASSVGVVALASASHDAKPAAPVGANAGRFLQLTGDGSAPTAAASGHSANASAGAAGSLPVVGGADAKCPEGAMSIPQGWCLTTAGDQTTVLRFPLGLVPTAHELQIVVTADSGAPQGIAVIDANNPQAVAPTALGANLFMGVAVTPAGKVYASGGNADRVFRFQLAGPTVVPTDATEAEPFPLHAGLNALADRAPPGSPHNFPASDGIYTGGYPGNSVLDGTTLYVAGSLSEAAPAGGCPSGQAACSQVKVIDTTSDQRIATIPVGLDAYGLALDKATTLGTHDVL